MPVIAQYARYPFTFLFLVTAFFAVVDTASAQRGATKQVSANAMTASSRVKGIWESVSYNQDIALESVYFVTPTVGWASGKNGTIIKTVDAGAHWTAQLGGDPQNDSKKIADLRFVDQRHGFAVQSTGVGDHTLLRTVDGQTWRASGTVPQSRGDYVFTSPTVGFASTHNEIRRTRDAGRSWQKVLDCATTVNVDGLSRSVVCTVESLSFPTPEVGYGLALSPNTGTNGVFIVKTTDGGNTWSISRVLNDENPHQGFIAFKDPNNGIVCTFEGRIYSTSNGGQTWDGIAGISCSGGISAGRFADPETGWVLANRHWSYTSDGGQRWGTRSIAWPADAYAFSLPRRDRGYVVGDHGMVYRYSIVPVEHTAPNAIDAPVVGAFTSPLDDQVEEFVADVGEFSAENGGPSFGGGNAGGSGSMSGAGGGSASGNAGSSDPNRGGAAFDPGSGSTAAAAGKAKRGGNTLGKLQALLDVIGTTMPDFLARYRNLNLLYEGARTAVGMPSWLQNVKSSLAAFRASTDKTSAAAALAQLLSATDSLHTQTNVAFEQTSFTPGPDDGASGFSFAPASPTVDSAKSGVKSAATDSAGKAVKDAVKKGLGGLFKFGKKH
jgi:photosystem II stability/assembly factor-like uncharacterized protein